MIKWVGYWSIPKAVPVLYNEVGFCFHNNMLNINEMIQKQLTHRTIREFKEKNIPIVIIDQLIEVARWTASSSGMQSFSIIRITDPILKKEIAGI